MSNPSTDPELRILQLEQVRDLWQARAQRALSALADVHDLCLPHVDYATDTGPNLAMQITGIVNGVLGDAPRVSVRKALAEIVALVDQQENMAGKPDGLWADWDFRWNTAVANARAALGTQKEKDRCGL